MLILDAVGLQIRQSGAILLESSYIELFYALICDWTFNYRLSTSLRFLFIIRPCIVNKVIINNM